MVDPAERFDGVVGVVIAVTFWETRRVDHCEYVQCSVKIKARTIHSFNYVDIRLHSVATKLEMTWDSFTINELVLVNFIIRLLEE